MSTEEHPLFGKWRITSMDPWDAASTDLSGPGYIRFDADRGGEFKFGSVEGTLDCEIGTETAFFTWEGSDDMGSVRGDGDAELKEDGTLSGEIRFDRGEESSFTARRW